MHIGHIQYRTYKNNSNKRDHENICPFFLYAKLQGIHICYSCRSSTYYIVKKNKDAFNLYIQSYIWY